MSQQKYNSKNFALLLLGAGFLLIALAVFLVMSQSPSASTTPAALSDEEADALVPRVSLNEAKTALDSGSAIFLDVRSAEAYQSEHIAGAINIPLAELVSRSAELNPNQWIITYCT